MWYLYMLKISLEGYTGEKIVTSCMEGDFSLCTFLQFLEFEAYNNVPSQILNKYIYIF